MKLSSNLNTTQMAILFICLHIVCWSLAPTFIRANLPMDSLEGAVWGQHLQWGYDRNPFLNGWLTAVAIYLGRFHPFAIYFLSQLSVGIALFTIWQIARKILTEYHALIALLILEGIQYYNFHAIDFNDNNLELSLWSLIIYFFYQAVKPANTKEQPLAWSLTGIFAGLGMMAKYYTSALLAAMTLFLLVIPQNRKHFRSKSLYLGLTLFLLILIPHIIWLFYHEFVTVTYVFDRANSIPSWRNHFTFAFQFAYDQILAFIPAVILLLFLFIKSNIKKLPAVKVSYFNKSFLWFVGVGPLILTLILSSILGIKLRGGWGMPLLTLWSILLISYLQPPLNNKKIKLFFAGIILLMFLLIAGYAKSLLYPTTKSSANYPGKKIAIYITQTWHHQYKTNLQYVAGSRWIASNIHYYSPDHPCVFLEWNKTHSPWINVNDMKKHGAVFVWDIDSDETLPNHIKQAFPRLKAAHILQFNWQHNYINLKPIKIGIAFLPPKKHVK